MNIQQRLLAALALATMATPPLALAQDESRQNNMALAAYVPPGEPGEMAASAQTAPSPTQINQAAFTQQELEQMLAPVALYPDGLLSQIMMASTYPLELVEAARWSRANPGLSGDDAVRAVEQQDWDPSVKSLVAFPQVLAQLDQNIAWTERLGNAFLAQQAQVLQTVQSLRQSAERAGKLASNQEMRVEQQGDDIMLQPADPQAVAVPYYDPSTAYGAIWSPAFQPAYFSPPYGYYPQSGFYWEPAILVSAGFFFGGFDWHRHCVNIVSTHPFYFHPGFGGRAVAGGPGPWQHDPSHRHGVAYRDPGLRQQFGRAALASGFARSNPAAMNAPRAMTGTPAMQSPAVQSHMQAPLSNQTRVQAQAHGMERPQQEMATHPQYRANPGFSHAQTGAFLDRVPEFAPQARFMPAMQYSAPASHFAAPNFSGAGRSYASSYSAPRPTMMASASQAHYSAPHASGGGNASVSHGGGGGGGGNRGGRR
jgi:hypothetical protein